ncbi:4HBT like protein [Neohortaea acidophila]|uniref:4HBT like protein n=1 Tax=Neohortaea acidophila TaxID=245834 RepID=A0A6A6PGF3_9PEZI|nr:4HBT like protein [Neohortaea acidophila]KAF2478713.1 4HBT like protein [Neohortaea acidophila]
MSAVTRLGLIGGVLTTSAALAGLSTLPAVRDTLTKHLGPNGVKHTWRLLALLVALLNLKNLPGFWHIRVLRGIIYQLYFQPHPQQPKHLFAPMITSSYNTPYDTDYNFHKSNSTYFADLDVARAHYMGCIIRTGLARLNKGDEQGLPKDTTEAGGKYFVALGSISCFFHKQIEPLQRFEIFTRVLSWDRKWLYVVSHIVKHGAVRPESYALQPWRKRKARRQGKGGEQEGDAQDLSKVIFATSVARYVFKKGRKTINPEVVLERSRLLPPRPDGVDLPPRTEGTPSDATPAPAETPSADDSWTWDDMEKERLRGLKIATHFDALSAAQHELRASEALGQYGDYW